MKKADGLVKIRLTIVLRMNSFSHNFLTKWKLVKNSDLHPNDIIFSKIKLYNERIYCKNRIKASK